MEGTDNTTLILELIQSSFSLMAAAVALYYNRRLAQEMNDIFKTVYGRLFNIERIFESKFMLGYFRLGFYIFGIASIIFAVFNITEPIYSW